MRSRSTQIIFTVSVLFALAGVTVFVQSGMAQSGIRPNANAAGGVSVGVTARRDNNRDTNPGA